MALQPPQNLDGERSTNKYLPGSTTGSLINGVTKYSAFHDTCVRFSFQVVPFSQTIVIMQIGLRYEISISVAGCSITIDRAMTMSLFSMCMMVNGY